MRNINELFEIINVQPKNVQIYELALTHSSFNADANTKHNDNERLEYMGDAVLDYVSADLIFYQKKNQKYQRRRMNALFTSLLMMLLRLITLR